MPRLASLLLALSLLAILGGCTREQDRFWPDTEQGLLSLTSPQVLAGDPERLIEHLTIDRANGRAAIPRLSHRLHIGDEVLVDVSVAQLGRYREGGGWIFGGREYFGRYGVAADLLSVESNRSEVLAAEVDSNGRLRLMALSPGRSLLVLKATMSRRYATRPADAPTHQDVVTFTVAP
jgi:hypothetical protein